nr:MAG TPA: hypothetical protein [Caudoviricetes sp.]
MQFANNYLPTAIHRHHTFADSKLILVPYKLNPVFVKFAKEITCSAEPLPPTSFPEIA